MLEIARPVIVHSSHCSPTGIPCVRLTIGDCRKIEEDVKVEPQQSEVVQPDDAAKDIAAPAYDVAACDLHDPLPRIKEVRYLYGILCKVISSDIVVV